MSLETELTLGLPGESYGPPKTGTKRGFTEPDVGDRSCIKRQDKVCGANGDMSRKSGEVVGWPPVRAWRRNTVKSCKYVKVAVDGAPYLRKVDLERYNSYEQLLNHLESIFSCFTIRNYLKDWKIMDQNNGIEYVATYEDKDGDWMLLGDVPWKLFVESCKRLRLMISSEATGAALRTPTN
ncbi:AUX/IAA transcriptional regulator family protein [Tripterygium wilfordii]|uniref:Auxin-responsive protein n=1 Tax=Tripterygium wilfordii TaxID=458696 RepID=A0A7J7D5W3_TRIWF|nr:auxin-responsive protein IAA1-like [Tripterygium wilfordii]KAF5741703.1 AUX/IAA transcriptional regulator family protein [Tripterygium wilfordii]